MTSCASVFSEAQSASAKASPTSHQLRRPQEDVSSTLDRSLLAQSQLLPVTAEVELGGEIIGLEVAQTRQQQALGLMARESLADDRGMLFPFDPPRPVSFWMKNVLISLDMVFLYDGDIVAIARDVPPCNANPCPTYGPEDQIVSHVIELRGGRAQELNLQIGDSVQIQWLDTVK